MKPWKKYLITSGIALFMTFGMLFAHNVATVESKAQVFRILADSFTIPGVLLLALGALVWVSSTGAMDGISYALGRAGRMLIPGSKKPHETFYDYKTRKAEKRVSGYGFIFHVGLVFFAVAVVFTVLFYVV